MRLLSISMGLVLAGCAPQLAGEWDGVCTTLVGATTYDYTLNLEIEDVKKGDVNGTLILVEETTGDTPTSISGPVDGSQDGDRVKLSALLSGGIIEGHELSIEAKIDGREISGDCQYNAQFGDVELELDE
jgi:hypothetical protein